ncbi:SKA complex subunit 2-like [Antedon mediterranea]|uniref:SKA complex subunit 2-like n=1 Tax=Antedon mediterranea TaxID=105859 RepID=UPI003AF7D148
MAASEELGSGDDRNVVVSLNKCAVENSGIQPLEHAMESAVNKVEALFQKAESDLDYMSRKLESEFADDNFAEKINPPDLLARLHEVKKDYAAIIKETEELKKAQLEAAQFFQTQLLTVCQSMKKLEVASGHELPELSEDEQHTLHALGLPMNGDGLIADESEQNQEVERVEKNDEIEESTITISTDSFPKQTPAELRKESQECVPLSQEEFDSVSTLIRGRAKLEDVNRVYGVLHEHFKDNSLALSVPDMSKMGMRVTGTTGTAKLKVLRSLKLLNIAKDGSVTIKK